MEADERPGGLSFTAQPVTFEDSGCSNSMHNFGRKKLKKDNRKYQFCILVLSLPNKEQEEEDEDEEVEHSDVIVTIIDVRLKDCYG